METMKIIRDKVQKIVEYIMEFSDFEKLDELEKLAKFLHEYKDLDGFQPSLLEEAQEDFGKRLKKYCIDKWASRQDLVDLNTLIYL